MTLVQADPTWALEYAHFKALCGDGARDRPVERHLAHRVLARLGARGGRRSGAAR